MSAQTVADLFEICDTRKRGYLTVNDLGNICPDFAQTTLRLIFDQLDLDRDGIVTKDDFEKGFETIMAAGQKHGFENIASSPAVQKLRRDSIVYSDTVHDEVEAVDLKKLDALPCQDDLLSLYSQLQTSGVPELLTQFEKVIGGVVKEIKDQRDMNEKLQHAYLRDKELYSKQMEEVETEMDSQIAQAEKKARDQERERLEREKIDMKRQMETEIFELQSNIKRLQKMETAISEGSERAENIERMKERLQQMMDENRHLKSRLTSAQTNVALVKAEFAQIRNEYEQRCQDLASEKEYLSAAVQEQENLSRQLQLLQDANLRLHDTNDNLRSSLETRQAFCKKYNLRIPSPMQGSVSQSHSRQDSFSSVASGHISAPDTRGGFTTPRPMSLNVGHMCESDRDSGMVTSGQEDDSRSPYYGFDSEGRPISPDTRGSLRLGESAINSDEERDRHRDKRRQDRRRSGTKERQSSLEATGPPERTFRVVMAGDASVGKSSFIMRLCKGRFEESIPSTLGVDFHVKTMNVDGKNVALQLWDTAGQERFRSLCKSYFRRSDGAVLMYDVTCEQSFLNVRNWMEVIKESAPRSIPILICANKTDARVAAVAEGIPVIDTETGQTMAKTYHAQFFEVSAKDGSGIVPAVLDMGRELLAFEDIEVKSSNVILGKTEVKSSGCCSSLRS